MERKYDKEKSKDTRERIVRMSESGLLQKDIADVLGVSATYVGLVIEDVGSSESNERRLHSLVAKRDNNECQRCGGKEMLRVLKLKGRRNNLNNLILLCENCSSILVRK